MDELNRYIRTKDFLHIAKGHLSRALNVAITSSFSQDALDMLRNSTLGAVAPVVPNVEGPLPLAV